MITELANGGIMGVLGADGKPVVVIGADSNGGSMSIYHASGESAIKMSIVGEHKKGLIGVWGKDHKGAITLGADESGGGMAIFNKGGKPVLQAGVSDMGGGIVDTRDKLGYRTGHLP